jgi:hypothetical protein
MPFTDAQKVAAFDALCPVLTADEERRLRLGLICEINHSRCEELARRGLMVQIVGVGWATTALACTGMMLKEAAGKTEIGNPKLETKPASLCAPVRSGVGGESLAQMVDIRPAAHSQQKIPGSAVAKAEIGNPKLETNSTGDCLSCGATNPANGWSDRQRELCNDCLNAMRGSRR